jgi:hypothetical protein
MVDKQWCLSQALELAKKHAEGGSDNVTSVHILEEAYAKLMELSAE